MRKPAPLEGASYDDVRVRLFGPVGAAARPCSKACTADGKVAKVRYTDVYVWNGADWRLVSGQNTPIKAEVAAAPADGDRARARAVAGTGSVRRRPRRAAHAQRELRQGVPRSRRRPGTTRTWRTDYVVVSGDGSFHDRAAALANFAKPTFATHMKSFPVDKVQHPPLRRRGADPRRERLRAEGRPQGREPLHRHLGQAGGEVALHRRAHHGAQGAGGVTRFGGYAPAQLDHRHQASLHLRVESRPHSGLGRPDSIAVFHFSLSM